MHTLLLPALSLLLGPASAQAPKDEVLLRPRREPGLVLTRVIDQSSTFHGDGLAVLMDGQEIPREYLPELTLDIDASQTLRLVDTLAARAVVRRYEALESEAHVAVDLGGFMGQDGEAFDATATSPLEGRAVRFSIAEDGDVTAAFVASETSDAGAEGDAGPKAKGAEVALLAGLTLDLDLAGWLPSEAVAPGARWQAPASTIAELFDPSGEVAWQWSRPDAEAPADKVTIDGEVECQLLSLVEADGRTQARVQVEGTFQHVATRATDLADVPVADGTATETRTSTYTLKGELLWDVAGGHLASAELGADIEQVSRTVKDAGQPGPEYESTLQFEGRQTFNTTVTRP